MPLTPEQLAAFQQDGYIIVPDVFDPASMQAVLAEVERLSYGMSFDEALAEFDDRGFEGVKDGFYEGKGGRSQFPVGVDVVDRLIEYEDYLDMFAQCLETDEMSYCNAHLFIRFGPTDKRHAEHLWQGYHIDHDTNCFLPPSADVFQYGYLNSAVYLHDVETDGAAMHVIPGSHTKLIERLPDLIKSGNWPGRSSLTDLRDAGFAEPVPATGRAGSVLFYNSYLVHAAVPFQNKRTHRCFWTLSMARADNHPWAKLTNSWRFEHRDFTLPFFIKTTARVRSLFGWPPPGHPYYTPQTLDLLATWYPGVDLEPYR